MAGSVVVQPNGSSSGSMSVAFPQLSGFMINQYSDVADTITSWGSFPGDRDRQLREFWPTEPVFASSLFTTVARYAAFGWSIQSGPRVANRMHDLLHNAEHGKGWGVFVTKVLIDLYTQDNGAFFEIVRNDNDASSPAVEINHLDSGRCVRTGRWDNPVIYYDLEGRGHLMPWYSVVPMEEFPSPDESKRGIQYSAITRCLRAAQTMREIGILEKEKASGRFTRGIHLVSGVPTKMIEDALKQHQNNADAQGLTRYLLPLVLGTLDPTAKVDHAYLELASLPDNFDREQWMRWYIVQMALAFGSDYSDYAPLPGQSLGSGNQAQVSLTKSRGKGPALFMRSFEHALNFHGVMPRTATFHFGEQDPAAEFDRITTAKSYAEYLKVLIEAGIITTEVARQMMVDRGFLDMVYLLMMREQNATDVINLPDSEREPPVAADVTPGLPGPKEAPTGAPPAPPNNNADRQKPNTATARPAVPS